MLEKKDLPQSVISSVHKMLKGKEVFDIYPFKVLYQDRFYYYIYFPASKDNVVIREDGAILPLSEVEEVLIMANSTDTMAGKMLTIGVKWANQQTIQTYTRIRYLLERLYSAYQNQMPPEIKQDFKVYLSVPEQIIQWQKWIEDIALNKAPKLVDRIKKEAIVTNEIYQNVRNNWLEVGKAAFRQNEILLKTQDLRRKVLKYLGKNIPLRHLRMKWLHWELSFHEMNMKMGKKDHEMYQELKVMVENKDDVRKDPGYLELIKHCRNPKS